MECPRCQFENREGVRVCEGCGAPLEQARPAWGAAGAGMVHASASLKILLVEDEATVRTVLTRMLTALGHSVLQASSVRDGLARLKAAESVDLVLTDLRMPEMSGWEVLKAVKAEWPQVRIGVITGTPQALSEQREPLDLVITKPVTFGELRDAISRIRP